MQSHACNAGLLFYTACCSSAIFSSISSVCVLPSPSSMMCLASQLGRQHRFCTALCTMHGFFMLYLVSGLGCSTKACHCVLWLVASCCAVPCCAVLCCGALIRMQYSCTAASLYPAAYCCPVLYLSIHTAILQCSRLPGLCLNLDFLLALISSLPALFLCSFC